MGRIIESRPVEEIIEESTSLDGLHKIVFNKLTHVYKLDGERVPGATTIGHVYPKGEGLIRWMIEQGIEEYDKKTALEKGGEVGTFLHKFAEAYELKQQAAIDALEVAATNSMYEREIRRVIGLFLQWREANDDKVLEMESLCASPAMHVGGVIDTLRERAGLGLVLSDYKTTKSIYISHLLQVVGGYRRMYREWCGVIIPYVEIAKFPKQEDQFLETLLCDENGWVKTIDGVPQPRVEVPGLFQRCEDQFERNLGTYRFQKEVENVLNPPYAKKD